MKTLTRARAYALQIQLAYFEESMPSERAVESAVRRVEKMTRKQLFACLAQNRAFRRERTMR